MRDEEMYYIIQNIINYSPNTKYYLMKNSNSISSSAEDILTSSTGKQRFKIQKSSKISQKFTINEIWKYFKIIFYQNEWYQNIN